MEFLFLLTCMCLEMTTSVLHHKIIAPSQTLAQDSFERVFQRCVFCVSFVSVLPSGRSVLYGLPAPSLAASSFEDRKEFCMRSHL